MMFFAYGTLQLDEVMEAVTGRRFEGTPAVLEGYRRRRLRSRVYPAIVPLDGEDTDGVVFRGLDDAALERLDEFEEDLYRRQELPVRIDGGDTALVWVYVLAPEHAELLSDEPWNARDFAGEHGEAFVRRHRQTPNSGDEAC